MSELLDLLPPDSRADADGMLIIGDCRVDDLANEFGTPVLVVAEEALRARAREYVAELTSRWPNAGVVANRLDGSEGKLVTVVGRHCESGDILVDGVPLNAPRVDDLLVVPATGAYCCTMSNNYNGNRLIPVGFVASKTPSLVVRRDTWDDHAARDVS